MMTRKGEITSRLHRKWPHHVALSADKVRGVESIVHRFANARSARQTFFLCRDDLGLGPQISPLLQLLRRNPLRHNRNRLPKVNPALRLSLPQRATVRRLHHR